MSEAATIRHRVRPLGDDEIEKLAALLRKLGHDLTNSLVAAVSLTGLAAHLSHDAEVNRLLDQARQQLLRPRTVLDTALAPLPLVRGEKPITFDGLSRLLQRRADDLGVRLNCVLEPAVARLGPLDEWRWIQVALPLCTNAFDALAETRDRQQPAPSRIDVALLPADHSGAELTVSDDGPGCSDLAAAANGQLRRAGGGHLGLGLAVAAAVVGRYGGWLDIWAAKPNGFVAFATVPACA
jgi:signal transduction histidine kinase